MGKPYANESGELAAIYAWAENVKTSELVGASSSFAAAAAIAVSALVFLIRKKRGKRTAVKV
jgi:hypothetical protein